MNRRRYTRGPNAIDPASGFKVKLADLVRDGQTGELVDRRFADRKQPQDFVRGVPEAPLPYSRPEVPDLFIAEPLLTESDDWILLETGQIMLSEGIEVTL